MNWQLLLVLTGVMLFSYWLNYVMGGPLSDDPKKVDVKAILFGIPLWLAIRRLKSKSLYHTIQADLINELAMTSDVRTKHKLRLDKRLDLYLSGREFFTWERSFLCPVCFHWWTTVLVGVIFLSFDVLQARSDFGLAAFTYLLNHLLIRKIS